MVSGYRQPVLELIRTLIACASSTHPQTLLLRSDPQPAQAASSSPRSWPGLKSAPALQVPLDSSALASQPQERPVSSPLAHGLVFGSSGTNPRVICLAASVGPLSFSVACSSVLAAHCRLLHPFPRRVALTCIVLLSSRPP